MVTPISVGYPEKPRFENGQWIGKIPVCDNGNVFDATYTLTPNGDGTMAVAVWGINQYPNRLIKHLSGIIMSLIKK